MSVGDGTNVRGWIVSGPWLIRSDFLPSFLREKVGRASDETLDCIITY